MTIEVKELRAAERYVFDTPLPGSFGASEVLIVNMGYGGVQIMHPLPIRIGSAGRLFFRLADTTVASSGRMVWSHLSKERDAKGKLVYRSGIRVEDADFAAAVRSFVERGYIRSDSDSLERKKQRLIQKERERSDKHLVKALPTESLSGEQALLIQHARERLRANPGEAIRLYEQARTADAAKGVPDDILAVWEYLERSIALATITKVFEGKI